MRADEMAKQYQMEDHIENGKFLLCHYPDLSGKRPASGSIYYYVSPGERTEFHQIDCDEYWVFNAGATLELWVIGTDGKLSRKYCGVDKDAEPRIFLKAGEIFASRLGEASLDGTFLTCITVPRFSEAGFTLFHREEMIKKYPETAAFWE